MLFTCVRVHNQIRADNQLWRKMEEKRHLETLLQKVIKSYIKTNYSGIWDLSVSVEFAFVEKRIFKAMNILASMLPHAWRLIVPIKVLLFLFKNIWVLCSRKSSEETGWYRINHRSILKMYCIPDVSTTFMENITKKTNKLDHTGKWNLW